MTLSMLFSLLILILCFSDLYLKKYLIKTKTAQNVYRIITSLCYFLIAYFSVATNNRSSALQIYSVVVVIYAIAGLFVKDFLIKTKRAETVYRIVTVILFLGWAYLSFQ